MTSTDVRTGEDLSLLFESPIRWGFEYVEPAPAAPSPERASPPQMRPVRVVNRLRRAALIALAGGVVMLVLDSSFGATTLVGTRAVAVVIINLVGAALTFYVAGMVVRSPSRHTRIWQIIGTFGAFFAPWLALGIVAVVAWRSSRWGSDMETDTRDQKRAQQELQTAVEAWRKRIAQFEDAEQRRYASADRWYPVGTGEQSRTVTVFGGSHITWAAALCTLGTSLLGAGARMLVLDFSRRWTTAPFFTLCGESSIPTRALVLPEQSERAGLFEDLSWKELSTILVEVIHSEIVDPAAAHREKQDDRSVIREVADHLDRQGEVSIHRLRQALLVIQGSPIQAGVISNSEFDALAGLYNEVQRQHGGVMERVTRLVRDLREFEALAAPGSSRTPHPLQPLSTPRSASLSVLEVDKRTDDLDNKRLIELLSQLLLRQMRNNRLDEEVIVILGADNLGRKMIESLADDASQQGKGLILFFEHLRGESIELIGGGGGSAVFGNLGNHREAQEATEFIGSDYKWVESSLTVSQGASVTETWGKEQGDGYQQTKSFPIGSSEGVSSTSSRSFSKSFGRTHEAAVGEARVYEKVLEPSVLQGLANTQLICVQVMSGGTRVTKTVDCLPGRRFETQLSMSPLPLPAG